MTRAHRQMVFGVLAILALGALWAGAQTGGPAPSAAAPAAPLRMESHVTLWSLIKSGGWAMWPLGACSFMSVWLVVLNFQRVGLRKMVPPGVVAQMKAAAAGGDLQQMHTVATTTDCFFSRVLVRGLEQVQPDNAPGSREKVEAAISEAAGHEEARYAFFVNFLALLTSMSPLWGLLGTVSGMIGAFSKIGAGGMGKPEMLAKNIGEALVCTATGLMVAILSMGFYFLFRNILNAVMKQVERDATEILDSLMGTGSTFGEIARSPTDGQK
jgi:biopolymer transport protein ExbB